MIWKSNFRNYKELVASSFFGLHIEEGGTFHGQFGNWVLFYPTSYGQGPVLLLVNRRGITSSSIGPINHASFWSLSRPIYYTFNLLVLTLPKMIYEVGPSELFP